MTSYQVEIEREIYDGSQPLWAYVVPRVLFGRWCWVLRRHTGEYYRHVTLGWSRTERGAQRAAQRAARRYSRRHARHVKPHTYTLTIDEEGNSQ